MERLAAFDDEEIEEVIKDNFSSDVIMAELDASSLYILLNNFKDRLEGKQTTWFDMEEL